MAGQNDNNFFVQGANYFREAENWVPDSQHPSSFNYDLIDFENCGPGFDQLSNPSESSTSVDSSKCKNSGGRPKKTLNLEKLSEFKDYTLEVAAKKLSASPSTVKRRVMELTGKTWMEFRQSLPDSQRQSEKETMQDEDKTVIAVVYDAKNYLFDLTKVKKPRRFQELEKHIKKSFNLLPKTYHVKYFREGEDHIVFNSDTLQGCLSLADQFNPIKLQVEVTGADKRT